MVFQDHVTNNHCISTITIFMITKFLGLTLKISYHKVIRLFDHVVLQNHVKSLKHYICTNTVYIAIKLGRMVTYFKGLLLIKSHCFLMWKIEKYIFTTTVLIITSFDRVVFTINNAKRLPSITSHGPFSTWSREVTWQIEISHITMPIVTKLVRMVIYRKELASIESYDPLVTWSCEVRWKIRYISCPFAEELWE